MAEEFKPIDISDIPELRRIVEDVQTSRQPRVLQRDSENLAMVVPIGKTRPHSLPDPAAALAIAGAWRDLVDGETLKELLRAERGSDRPLASL